VDDRLDCRQSDGVGFLKLSVPNAERIFLIRHALRAGFTIEEIFGLSKIDRWFLVQIKENVDFGEELASAKN
jgi:carbamoyl-phosphate synthase large subunit